MQHRPCRSVEAGGAQEDSSPCRASLRRLTRPEDHDGPAPFHARSFANARPEPGEGRRRRCRDWRRDHRSHTAEPASGPSVRGQGERRLSRPHLPHSPGHDLFRPYRPGGSRRRPLQRRRMRGAPRGRSDAGGLGRLSMRAASGGQHLGARRFYRSRSQCRRRTVLLVDGRAAVPCRRLCRRLPGARPDVHAPRSPRPHNHCSRLRPGRRPRPARPRDPAPTRPAALRDRQLGQGLLGWC